MQFPAALPGPRGYQGPLRASGNGAFGTSPEESLPTANRHHCREGFYAAPLTFSFPRFQLVAPNYLPSDRPAGIGDQSLACLSTSPPERFFLQNGPLKMQPLATALQPSDRPQEVAGFPVTLCLAWGVRVVKPGSPRRREYTIVSSLLLWASSPCRFLQQLRPG